MSYIVGKNSRIYTQKTRICRDSVRNEQIVQFEEGTGKSITCAEHFTTPGTGKHRDVIFGTNKGSIYIVRRKKARCQKIIERLNSKVKILRQIYVNRSQKTRHFLVALANGNVYYIDSNGTNFLVLSSRCIKNNSSILDMHYFPKTDSVLIVTQSTLFINSSKNLLAMNGNLKGNFTTVCTDAIHLESSPDIKCEFINLYMTIESFLIRENILLILTAKSELILYDFVNHGCLFKQQIHKSLNSDAIYKISLASAENMEVASLMITTRTGYLFKLDINLEDFSCKISKQSLFHDSNFAKIIIPQNLTMNDRICLIDENLKLFSKEINDINDEYVKRVDFIDLNDSMPTHINLSEFRQGNLRADAFIITQSGSLRLLDITVEQNRNNSVKYSTRVGEYLPQAKHCGQKQAIVRESVSNSLDNGLSNRRNLFIIVEKFLSFPPIHRALIYRKILQFPNNVEAFKLINEEYNCSEVFKRVQSSSKQRFICSRIEK
ncbi:MAG: hypothetical protein MHMPM18_000006 [Marteilia pararefringens]